MFEVLSELKNNKLHFSFYEKNSKINLKYLPSFTTIFKVPYAGPIYKDLTSKPKLENIVADLKDIKGHFTVGDEFLCTVVRSLKSF